MNQSRRQFLKSTAIASAAFAMPATSWARVRGANEDIRVAVIGFNSRGMDHIKGFQGVPGVRLVALCDVDQQVLAKGKTLLAKDNIQVETYTDVRKLLENGSIDAISTATPNHWHSLIGIWAVQNGKDAYVEKPVSHNVWEGRQLVKAARKYNKIVQTGTQSRSNPGLRQAVEWVRAGNLGKITLARGLCYKPRQSIGKVSAPTPIPDYIDYDLWCGPSPKAPLHRAKLHYDWHWQFITGNGDVGNQGIHQMDIARWILGENQLSPMVLSVGGRVGYSDDGDTPNSQFVYHGYAKAPLIFEVRGLPKSKEFQNEGWGKNMDVYKGASIGVIVECEGGYVSIPTYDSAKAYDKAGKLVKEWRQGADHYANFIAAVRSRKVSDLNADIEEGHLSSALCHMGNISHRLGSQLNADEIRDRLRSTPDAAESFGRLADHLGANGVRLSDRSLSLGPSLWMDGRTETFVGNRAANALLTREYRKGFEVPSKV